MQLKQSRLIWVTGFALVGAVLIAGLEWPHRPAQSQLRKQPAITIGIQTSPAMALIMVAEDEGFFDDEGINCTIVPFAAGKLALQAFLAGSIDLAVSGEVPTCLAAIQGNRLQVVAQVVKDTVNEVRVVARRDSTALSGDAKAYFLAKRRTIATSFGGGPEVYTYTFFKHLGIAPEQIEVVSQKPEDMPAALASKSVDAVAIFDPFAYLAEQRLGSEAVTFADPGVYSQLYVINAKPEQIIEQRKTLLGVLRALVAASKFIEMHPEESKIVVQRYTKLERNVIDGVWENFDFRPALTTELIDNWRMEADWARESGKVSAGVTPPDWAGDLVDESLLLEVSPKDVEVEE